MGSAVAVRKAHDEHEGGEQISRRTLGANAAHETVGMLRLKRLGSQRAGLKPEQLRAFVVEAFKEDLKTQATAGLSKVPEIVHLIEKGEKAKATLELAEAGLAAWHASELVGLAAAVLIAGASVPAISVAVLIVAGVHCVKLMIQALRELGANKKFSFELNAYASVWADAVTGAVFHGMIRRPPRNVFGDLDSVNMRAFADAMAALDGIDAQGAAALAEQFRQQFGSEANAKHALQESILREAGVGGMRFFNDVGP